MLNCKPHQAPVGVLLSARRASLVATISTRICDIAVALMIAQRVCRLSLALTLLSGTQTHVARAACTHGRETYTSMLRRQNWCG